MPKISQETIDRVEYVDVLDLAIRMGHWTNRSGNSTIVYCPNPNHSENTPDCKIKHTTGLFTCFGGGGCGAKGGPLQYYSWYTFGDWNAKTHFVDSVIGVCEIMGIEVVYEDGQAKKSVNYVYNTPPQRVNESIPAKSPEECHKVYQRMLSLCPIYREHALEWVNKRKYSKEQILSIGLKSIPATYDEKNLIINALLKEGYDLERIPGFTKKLRSNGDPSNEKHWFWTMAAYGKYFIPVRDENGYIVRLRLATEIAKKKYTWFSTEPNVKPVYENDRFTGVIPLDTYRKDELEPSKLKWGGASSSHHLNVVVPSNLLAAWEAGTAIEDIYNFDYVIVTEGEHKANIVSEIVKTLVIGVPGVGIYKEVLPLLRLWGIKKLVIAYDADAFIEKKDNDGKAKVNEVLKNLIYFAKDVLEHEGIEILFWMWNIEDGKGLDDLLIGAKKNPMEVNLDKNTRTEVKLLESIRKLVK